MAKFLPIIFILVLAAIPISSYNGMKNAEINVNAAYGQVENQMQRRADLIPNLVSTVKGYAAHESTVLSEVSEARSKLVGAGSAQDKDAANTELSGALSRLLAISEAYPELKADTQFSALTAELSGSENRIAVARRDYNDAIREYNSHVETFPGNIIAGIFGFKPMQQFKADPKAAEVPKVAF